jgi:urease accessory protein
MRYWLRVWRNTGLAAVPLALAAGPASAHLVSTGLGPAYDGISHFLLSPEFVAPVLGLALFAGLRGPDHARRALFTITGAWFLSGLAGIAPPAGLESSLTTATIFLTLGGLLAADASLSLMLTTLVAGVVGLVGGAMSTAAAGALPFTGLLGVTAAVFVITALVSSLVVPLRIAWMRIAVRVAGSWLAALGLLLVGWAIRTGT